MTATALYELTPETTEAEFLAHFGLGNVCECCGFDSDEEDDDKLYDFGWLISPNELSLGVVCPLCALPNHRQQSGVGSAGDPGRMQDELFITKD